MSVATKSLGSLVLLIAVSGFGRAAVKRPITVADIIGMTRVAGSPWFAYQPKSEFAVFSPNGKKFAIVLTHGDVAANTNDYTLLVFGTADGAAVGHPKTIAAVASASNDLGIFDLQWSNDNDTIFFLATVGKKTTQLYSVDCSSGTMRQLTHHDTPLISYSVSRDGRTIAYEAESAPSRLLDEAVLRHGFYVGREELSDLIRGTLWGKAPELFVEKNGYPSDKPLRTKGELRPGYGLSLSPNGRYLAVQTDVMKVPKVWGQYRGSGIQSAFHRGFLKDVPTGIMRYEVIDTETGQTERPLDSPAGYCPSVLWSPDSQALLLCGVYLPLDVRNPRELQARRSNRFVVEIDPATDAAVKVSDQDLIPVDWDARANVVEFETQQTAGGASGSPAMVFYRKSGKQWEQAANSFEGLFPSRPHILVEEDLNRPPQVVAVEPRSKQRVKILDLNPGLSGFELGKVELISWKDGAGQPVSGALYLPFGYFAGKRYPLVIQTHGFDPHGFWLEGPYSSGFAAQVLADRGIAVLQMNDIFNDSLVTRREASRAMKTYENAVNYLDRKGVIDPERVGLLGFSRTCYYVEYALTHSKRRFAAAVAVDGIDVGYLQYLVAAVARPLTASEFDVMVGSPPFGAGLHEWLKRSPGFLVDRIRTPLLIQAFGPPSVLDEWQTFAGLKRLGKPVDLLYLPGATHVLVKPWDRLASQDAAAEWFYFWLRGTKDPAATKTEQFRRWLKLRRK